MRLLRKMVSVVLFIICLGGAFALAGPEDFTHPLINPFANSLEHIQGPALPEEVVNILLVGIDYGEKGYRGSAYKDVLENCHADAMLVVTIHPKTNRVDLVSIPRDTFTYVPGVRGIYKLNASINCGDGTVEDGLEKACEAAAWVLGGVPIDYYCAVDMVAMAALGDAMGGIDFEIEMSYTGHSGKKYYKGMTHLDGIGITDYLRSRTNATVNGNDLGRTGRQRALMVGVFQKLKDNPLLLLKMTKEIQNSEGFHTNMSINTLMPYVNMGMKLKEEDLGSHVITGTYRTGPSGWNFTFTDQEHRQAVIKEVYGIDVEPLPFVSYKYSKWVEENGMKTVRDLSLVAQMLKSIEGTQNRTEEQEEAIGNLVAAYDKTASAFVAASDSMSGDDLRLLKAANTELRSAGDLVAKLCAYENLTWLANKYWYRDPFVNEKAEIDWR